MSDRPASEDLVCEVCHKTFASHEELEDHTREMHMQGLNQGHGIDHVVGLGSGRSVHPADQV